jgi:hypothetical protein
MAAETLTADRAAASFPVAQGHTEGALHVAWGTYAVAATVEDGDIFEMCKVPAGATIVGGYVACSDMDTGTEVLDLMAGWAANGTDIADPNGLMLAHVFTGDISVHLDVASSIVFFGGVLTGAGPKTLLAETTLQIEANTPSNVFAAGQLTMVVYYTCT